MPKQRRMIQCATSVNRDAVRRETINGVEHVIVSSYTLPDDVVMNGGLYPADEIEAGFKTLERTLAPVEHPTDANGNFISASDPDAIHNFYAGAYNVNVTRKDGRVHIEKFINVQEAMKTDRGKRLMDRVNEIETSESARPVHTSVGVFIDVEETPQVMTNAAGMEYNWIARNMSFDHDAILLDSVGAAQPDQGVGLAVNRAGEEMQVDRFVINEEPVDNQQSLSQLEQAVAEGMDRSAIRYDWIEELYPDSVIFRSSEQYYTVPYTVDETTDRVTIVGIPLTVERNVTFTPKVNSEKGDAMKDLMLKALADAGMTVNAEISDADLLAEYSKLLANQSNDNGDEAGNDNAADLAAVVANAIAPLSAKIGELEGKFTANSEKEHNDLAELIANSDKFPGFDKATAMLLPVEKLRAMSANVGTAHGVPLTINSGSSGVPTVATVMPE